MAERARKKKKVANWDISELGDSYIAQDCREL
jgi:hypothetical protein